MLRFGRFDRVQPFPVSRLTKLFFFRGTVSLGVQRAARIKTYFDHDRTKDSGLDDEAQTTRKAPTKGVNRRDRVDISLIRPCEKHYVKAALTQTKILIQVHKNTRTHAHKPL